VVGVADTVGLHAHLVALQLGGASLFETWIARLRAMALVGVQ
jgi:hypothetical protein